MLRSPGPYISWTVHPLVAFLVLSESAWQGDVHRLGFVTFRPLTRKLLNFKVFMKLKNYEITFDLYFGNGTGHTSVVTFIDGLLCFSWIRLCRRPFCRPWERRTSVCEQLMDVTEIGKTIGSCWQRPPRNILSKLIELATVIRVWKVLRVLQSGTWFRIESIGREMHWCHLWAYQRR